MRVVAIAAGLVLFLFLVGCNGKTAGTDSAVDSDFYGLTVADDMIRVDGSDSYGRGMCVGPGCPSPSMLVGLAVQGELYASVEDNVPTEFCQFLRERVVATRGTWELPKGQRIEVNGGFYYEGFGVLRLDKDNERSEGFRAYLAKLNYEAPKQGYLIYKLTRHKSPRERMEIYYLLSFDKIPPEAKANGKAMGQFIRSHFAKRVQLS